MQLFLDCDGVLADFDAGAERVLGLPPREFERRRGLAEFWRRLARAPDFYATLPLMADAMILYEGVRRLGPIILTGCPRGGWAERQKVRWAARHFPGVPIVTCMAARKCDHCNVGDVLVDDTLKYEALWRAAGGVFIHHHSARETLAELRRRFPEAMRPESPGTDTSVSVPNPLRLQAGRC